VEIELLAPRGRTRADLAAAVAGPGGRVARFFHPQSEPSKVPGTPVFDNLTLGFSAFDENGALVARCVDDLTLQDDLDRTAAPRPGWLRVVSDDARLLRLVARHADPEAPLETLLDLPARLFGVQVELGPNGMRRLADDHGAPIAIALPLPGERERPCELVTPPIDAHLAERLEALLAPAREMGFTIPAEAAVHLHFDAAALYRADAVRALVRLWRRWGPTLKRLMRPNPRCRRLGDWPDSLVQAVEAPDFASLAWPDARARLAALGLTKYCDLNLRNLAHDVPGKPTVEVRVLPGAIRAAPIVEAAALFEGLLRAAERADARPEPPAAVDRRAAEGMLWSFPMDELARRTWLIRAATL
jgi:hypothetical protein